MKNDSGDVSQLLPGLKDEEYCYLTTTGRVTGKPHEIEIWFGLNDNVLYLLSGGMDRSDWVKNLLKDPAVSVRVATLAPGAHLPRAQVPGSAGEHTFAGTARLVKNEKEEMMARYLLAEKYQEWETGRTLSEWARTALVVAIDMGQGG